jgi:hypothetical protein
MVDQGMKGRQPNDPGQNIRAPSDDDCGLAGAIARPPTGIPLERVLKMALET